MNTFAHLPPYANSPPLCDPHGHLNAEAIGWSSRPQTLCDLPGNTGRRKRWNHWCINAPGWMLSLTIADLDYLGYGAIYFLDLETGQAVHRTQITPLGLGCELPGFPNQSHSFQHGDLSLSFAEQPGQLRITASAPDLGGLPLDLALEVKRPAHLESVNLNVPMGGRCFHACSRQMGLPVRGSMQLGRSVYQCSEGASFAALDFGRGVWPFRTHWTRAAFAAPGGIAGNFGSGWTDHSELSENALWFGGELQRLGSGVEIEQAPTTLWRRGACAVRASGSTSPSPRASCTAPAHAWGRCSPRPASGSATSTARCAASTTSACPYARRWAGSAPPTRAGDTSSAMASEAPPLQQAKSLYRGN